MIRKRLLFCVLVIALLGWPSESRVSAGLDGLPFLPRERLVFAVRWGIIPAGEAILETRSEKKDGVALLHFTMKARTYSYVDLFYKVRDRVDSYTDAALTHSLLYIKKNRGRKTRDITVRFDWDKKEAEYIKNGRSRKTISLPTGAFDPLSIFYSLRTQELEVGKTILALVCDGKRWIRGDAKVVKREKITVGGNDYETFLVIPRLKGVGGVFEKSKNAKLQIWVTTDSARIPVRIKSKVAVGSFVAELKEAHVPAQGFRQVWVGQQWKG